MRNLFRVLLVSSALVAVSAPSAYATPQEEATASIANNIPALTNLVTPATATSANLLAATALCVGNKQCVINLIAVYAAVGYSPREAELAAIAQGAGVTFTTAELAQYSIGAVGGTPPAGGTQLPGTGPEQNAGGSEAPAAAPSSTGPTGSAT